jgi:hypothetical protein
MAFLWKILSPKFQWNWMMMTMKIHCLKILLLSFVVVAVVVVFIQADDHCCARCPWTAATLMLHHHCLLKSSSSSSSSPILTANTKLTAKGITRHSIGGREFGHW